MIYPGLEELNTTGVPSASRTPTYRLRWPCLYVDLAGEFVLSANLLLSRMGALRRIHTYHAVPMVFPCHAVLLRH
jgi:hypothetical protein